MGQLHNLDGWSAELPDDIVTKLQTWVDGERFSLRHLGWFGDGRSGGPVARALRMHEDHGTDQVVLKFFPRDGKRKAQRIRQGWDRAGDFQKRLARAEDQTIPLGDEWTAVFLHIAGGAGDKIMPLADNWDKYDFPNHCAHIVEAVIMRWNENICRADSENPRTVSGVLIDMMGRRQAAVEKWAFENGISIDPSDRAWQKDWAEGLANPFTLVHGEEGAYEVEALVTGKAHGDLSGRNVLVRKDWNESDDKFFLIDYDGYSETAPLARDPMHLLLALTLDRFAFDDFGERLHSDLARVLVHPQAADTPRSIQPLRELSDAIHKASKKLALSSSLGEQWEDQCLLSLVGAGLVHLGRDLRVRDEHVAKEWCFRVAALATKAYLERRPAPPPGKAAQAPATGLGGDSTELVHRRVDRRRLYARLADGPWGVVVVRGARGVGKTSLVDAVLSELHESAGKVRPRIHRHDVRTLDGLPVSTLIDYVEGHGDPVVPHPPGGSSLLRLEHALRKLREAPVVIVVDSAERLLDPATKTLVDPDLDEALELIATEPGHRAAVLMVTRQDPASPADGTWPTTEPPVHVPGLPCAQFLDHLASRDHDRRTDPRRLSDDDQSTLHRKLQGNPRLAELAHAVVVAVESGLDLPDLANLLRGQDTRDVPTVLTRLLVKNATPVQRHVLEAVAAFGIPVPEAAIIGLLADEFSERYFPETIRQALSTLVASRIVHLGEDNRYGVPPEDAQLILSEMADEERNDRCFYAAEQLTGLRNDDPRQVSELRVHFAEVNALLNANEPRAAFELITSMDEMLANWNCRHLLLEQRKEIRTRLDEYQQTANENALGLIYASLGEFDEADLHYGRAMRLAGQQTDSVDKPRLHVNLATMYWEQHDIVRALSQYEFARDEATRFNSLEVKVGALEGIADCHRRNGDYDQAIRYAEEALAIPGLGDYPDSREAQDIATSRSSAIMLKLARWYGETGREHHPERFIKAARDQNANADSLSPSQLDGLADMYFDRGDLARAEETALMAEAEALRLQDPVTLMQARTTLSFIHLKTGDLKKADHAIKGAWRYRRNRRSLVVLALYALAARQKKNPGADALFRQLRSEAADRIKLNSRDFAAWHYKSFAICGQLLESPDDLDEAIEALRAARNISPSTPLLNERLKLIFTQLDQCGRRHGRLSHVVEELTDRGPSS